MQGICCFVGIESPQPSSLVFAPLVLDCPRIFPGPDFGFFAILSQNGLGLPFLELLCIMRVLMKTLDAWVAYALPRTSRSAHRDACAHLAGSHPGYSEY